MPITLVSPINEMPQPAAERPKPLPTLAGKTVGMLDISKPGGSTFLDRVESILIERHGVLRVLRETKPTFTKPAPEAVIEKLRGADAVIEALAD